MRIKAILLTVASAIFGAGFGTATAEPVSGGQASEFRLLNTSSASASDGRLLWSGAQTHDPQMCWQVFQSCQFFCGHQHVFIPDPSDTCAYACWEDYLNCMGFY